MKAQVNPQPTGEAPQLRVGLFPGVFDPVHNGHIEAARRFMEQMRLDYLMVLPTGRRGPQDQPGHRLRMCQLAFAGMDGVVVADHRVLRPGTDLDTARELTAPDRRLLLLCGTEEVLAFDKRENYRELLSLCYPVYLRCENDRFLDEVIVQKLSRYYAETGKMFRKLAGDPLAVSSSDIRKRLAQGEDISHLVPSAVAEYIRENRLYQNR